MLKITIFAGAAIVALAGYTPRSISEADKAEIMAQADLVLYDGPSARWRWGERLHPSIYCGHVNAKNRFGAYAGWQPFYYALNKLRIIGPDDSRVNYEALCSTGGYIEKPDWLTE